ncbi:MAG: hypothetical protein MI867_15815 [Pseudomonadales bacterium]|nr:hypothetical protein [Pseudomonadales bacterium]
MTIKIDQYTDAFTHHVYQQIDPKVRVTFTPSQVTAIENAIRASRPYQKHPIDMRGVIPLYFLRVYFVLLMGRDKRSQTRNKEEFRRKKAAMGSALASMYAVICMMLPVLLLVLYTIKAVVGIDFFEGIHLSDFLGWGY